MSYKIFTAVNFMLAKQKNNFDGTRICLGNAKFRVSFDYSRNNPEFDESKKADAHSHSYYELQVVLSGAIFIYADKKYTVEKNQILIIAPNRYHSVRSGDEPTARYAVGIELERTGAKNTNEKSYAFFKEILNSCDLVKLTHCKNFVDRLRNICSLMQSEEPLDYFRMQGALQIWIADFFDKLGKKMKLQRLQLNEREKLTERDLSILDIDSYVSGFRKFGAFATLGQLSEELYLSKKQINCIMKEKYNTTYKQKLIQTRIEYAKKHLIEDDVSVESIAYSLGYTNLTSFYAAFRRIVGCTPNEFRNREKTLTKKESDDNKK